jgi:hypothetical protein
MLLNALFEGEERRLQRRCGPTGPTGGGSSRRCANVEGMLEWECVSASAVYHNGGGWELSLTVDVDSPLTHPIKALYLTLSLAGALSLIYTTVNSPRTSHPLAHLALGPSTIMTKR